MFRDNLRRLISVHVVKINNVKKKAGAEISDKSEYFSSVNSGGRFD